MIDKDKYPLAFAWISARKEKARLEAVYDRGRSDENRSAYIEALRACGLALDRWAESDEFRAAIRAPFNSILRSAGFSDQDLVAFFDDIELGPWFMTLSDNR